MRNILARVFDRPAQEKNSFSPETPLDFSLDSLSWIYDFWNSLSPYAYARLEDETIILPPNLVYRTNATGVQLLDFISRGGRIEEIPGFSFQRVREIEEFFISLKNAYLGVPQSLEKVAFDFQFTKLPVLGEIALTYRCNNRCLFCYAGCGGELSDSSEAELTTDELKKIITLFKEKAKIPFFSFTGGEPLLREDLEELCSFALSIGLRINLITNGTLASPERSRSLKKAGLSTAQVSLESPEALLHDKLCGAPGAYQKTLQGIEALQDAGIQVQTNSTLTRINQDSLLLMPAFIRQLGVKRFSMNLFIPTGSGKNAHDLMVPYVQTGDWVDQVRKNAHRENLEFYWYSPTPLCIYNPIARGMGNKACAACDGLLSVSPQGDVLPCSSWKEPVGNLLREEFSSIWFGKKAQWFKNKDYAPENCQKCSSFSACQAACPLYWEAIGYAELHPHWKNTVETGV